MSQHQVRAVFKQFPWLHKHFGLLEAQMGEACVSRISTETLKMRTGTVSVVVCGEIRFTSRIFLFDGSGNLLTRVQEKNIFKRLFTLFFPKIGTITPEGKSVYEELIELGDNADQCAYVVLIVNHWKIVVFRKQNEVSIPELMSELQNEDETEQRLANEAVTKAMQE
jgi:hypothetical protein